MMTTEALPQALPLRKASLPKVAVAVALVAAADVLLFRQFLGLSLVIFGVLLAAGIFITHRSQSRALIRAACAAFAIAPLVENVSVLSTLVSCAGLAALALMTTGRLNGSVARRVFQVVGFGLMVPFRLLADLVVFRKIMRRMAKPGRTAAHALGWLMPIAVSAVFLMLFGMANPVLDRWLAVFDIWAFIQLFEAQRIGFWLLAMAGIWAFLRPRLPPVRRKPNLIGPVVPGPMAAPTPLGRQVFGRTALLRSLLLFNAIFSMQTVLDMVYLWGGVALPDGMTYAEYAHRGAYPLIATALLAAAFVLAALRPGRESERDPVIRRLVYLWVAQNVMLVMSSIFRLDLYVGVYALTYWRIAAFLWMALVAVGLVLIVARIRFGKSSEWLASANLLTLSALLYACCFINFAALIAGWNIDHSREISGQGIALDSGYVVRLGPQALPAMDRFAHSLPAFCYGGADSCFSGWRSEHERALRERMSNWRGWTFRNWRLMQYLDARLPAAQDSGARP